jgi:hypothetical protein
MPFHSIFVASKAGLVLRLVDWFAVNKSAEPPNARGTVLFRVFDHDLDCGGRTGDESGFKFRGLNMLPGELCKNGSIREGNVPFR